MLLDGHEISSPLPRGHLWEQLVALENVALWSALEGCASSGGTVLGPTSSYVCTHDDGLHDVDATVEVTAFRPPERLTLRTETHLADLAETIELRDRRGGTLLLYSVEASSAGFGPRATMWLHRHVLFMTGKLDEFANRSLL